MSFHDQAKCRRRDGQGGRYPADRPGQHGGVLMTLGKSAGLAGHKAAAIGIFEDILAVNAGGNAKTLVEASRELGKLYESGKAASTKRWRCGKTRQQADAGRPRSADQVPRFVGAQHAEGIIENAAMSGKRGAAARSTQTDAQQKQQQLLDMEKGEIKSVEDLGAL